MPVNEHINFHFLQNYAKNYIFCMHPMENYEKKVNISVLINCGLNLRKIYCIPYDGYFQVFFYLAYEQTENV